MGKHDPETDGRPRAQRVAPTAALHFVIERERAAVGRFNAAVEQALQGRISESALRAMQVALDELLTNVIMHGGQAVDPIEIDMTRSTAAIDATLRYAAAKFDPTTWQPDVHGASLATARIGGLGIALVRSLMDDFRYSYDDGRNVVMLRKRC
jgi:anti-sigma regulatory factor (Ser/Thr protein kinase)